MTEDQLPEEEMKECHEDDVTQVWNTKIFSKKACGKIKLKLISEFEA